MRCAISTNSVIKEKMVLLPSSFDLSVDALPSNTCLTRTSTLGSTDSSTAMANTMSINSSSRHPESNAASLSSTAMENETENATSLPNAFNANVADMRLHQETGDRTKCTYTSAFINRQVHYEQRMDLAFPPSKSSIRMTLRGLFVTRGSFKQKRVHRANGGCHLVYGLALDNFIDAFSVFGVTRRRVQLECFRAFRQMRAQIHSCAPLRESCQAFRLVLNQRESLLGDATCKRGVGACTACFLWLVLMRKHAPSMLSSQTILVVCRIFHEKVQAALEDASEERDEWRVAIETELQGLHRACEAIHGSVDDAIDGFQRSAWGVVGLDYVDHVDRVIDEEADSLISFDPSL